PWCRWGHCAPNSPNNPCALSADARLRSLAFSKAMLPIFPDYGQALEAISGSAIVYLCDRRLQSPQSESWSSSTTSTSTAESMDS
ncbi:MAG: hypothetical protein WCD63_23895, partial [Terrimicrobiaceae bacterium]